MIRILFIRHGATKGNLEKRYIGRTDEPLCDLGIEQIAALRDQKYEIDYLCVSPMLRTRQTANILFPDVPQIVVDDLRESDFGVFEGKTSEELKENADYRKWVDSLCSGEIPGGEAVNDFKKRCCSAFRKMMKLVPDNSTVAFVVHGGTIMAILEAYAQPAQDFYAYHINNGETVSACFRDEAIYLL